MPSKKVPGTAPAEKSVVAIKPAGNAKAKSAKAPGAAKSASKSVAVQKAPSSAGAQAKSVSDPKSAAKAVLPSPRPAAPKLKKSAATKESRAAVSSPARKMEPAPVNEPSAPAPDALVPSVSADLVDQQLARYRSMRDFHITAEPSGGDAVPTRTPQRRARPTAEGLPFVIQKHAASHLHYDFRLGWSGVLKSWAVAKGPSYVVADRRLAVQVEDHPIEYGGFEGVIPHGQYGGGTVMVWDQGTWWPQPGHENVEAGLRTGSLKFELKGTKLQGKWTLIRMHATRAGGGSTRWKSSDKPQWLLIKEHDAFERPVAAIPIVEAAPNSALTGRSMEQIAAESDHIWNSKETAGPGQAWHRQEPLAAPDSPVKAAATLAEAPALRISPRPRAKTAPGPVPRAGLPERLQRQLDDLPREPQPEFIQPQLAQEAEDPPETPGWLHELKLDGYRMQARKSPRGVQMLTRSGLDWTYRVPAVAEAVAALPVVSCTLDGEVVVLAEDGTTNFAHLQASFQNQEKHPLTFFCFDLLHLEGHNTRNLPLRERKAMLSALLRTTEEQPVVRISEHLETSGRIMFEEACRFHAEGIISKRADDPYEPGRRSSWLKSKCLHEQEFVIGGFAASSDGPDRIGSLLLGYYDASRTDQLIFAGRAGTGYTQRQRKELFTLLAPFAQTKVPFAKVPTEQRRDVTWVQPTHVAQVRFASWTAEDLVRQAAFLGLREDKPAQEVTREAPSTPPQPKSNERKPTSNASRASTFPTQGKAALPPAATAPVRLTHPQKVLDPATGLTKQQLADYFWHVASRMLPYVAERPLSLVRCPDGAGKPCFYQKHVNSMLPPGVGSVMVADSKGGPPEPYITLKTPEALTGLAQMGVLEVHPWSSRNDALECPDCLIFDLDPDEDLPWTAVAEAAADVRARLHTAGLKSFVKVTGGKGLHIFAPIAPEHDFATIKTPAHRFVTSMERSQPRLYLTKMTKAARKGKIYLDYLRNERGATAVAPYSPRARTGVCVSLPLEWKELAAPQLPRFPLASLPEWQERLQRDPWKGFLTLRQRLDPNRLR